MSGRRVENPLKVGCGWVGACNVGVFSDGVLKRGDAHITELRDGR